MPKAKYAHRGKAKPKSIKAKTVLSSKRKLSRFGKKQKKGLAGEAVLYITRTRAIKKLQITLRDFRRLCILKGIYPREPKNKKAGDTQTYYHVKDIAYLAHEPLLQKFRDFKVFLRKVSKALNRQDLPEARRIYERTKPILALDHLIRERYPRFDDAVGDLDDALSMVHLFAALPALYTITTDRTRTARKLAKEWQYFVARSHALRRVFLSVKGIYFGAEVRGIPVVWLQPWQFSQSEIPSDVDYRVMTTFLDFHTTLLQFVLLKLYHSLGLAYPPVIRDDVDAAGGHLAAVAVKQAAAAGAAAADGAADASAAAAPAAAASSAVVAKSATGKAASASAAVSAARLASLKDKLKTLATSAATSATAASGGRKGGDVDADADEEMASASSSAGAAGGAGAAAAGSRRAGGSGGKRVIRASMYDFVDAEDDALAAATGAAGAAAAGAAGGAAAGDEELRDMQEFAADDETKAVLAKARALRAFSRLFGGLLFFLNREVPRETFEFIICSFRGRVGWDGPGSPFAASDPRITHHVIDRPLPADGMIAGREYVQPQWVADSINARMLLPVAKYAPGAVLPPHLSPFVDDAKEGYIPAYRHELDRLRAAAAVTGRLADVVDAAATAAAGEEADEAPAAAGRRVASRMGADADDDEDTDDEEDAAAGARAPASKRARVEAAASDDEDEEDDDDDDEEEEGDDEEEEEEEDAELLEDEGDEEEDDEEAVAAALQGTKKKAAASGATVTGGNGVLPADKLSALERERRALAMSMMTNKKRKTYERVMSAVGHAHARVQTLADKAAAAAAKGDAGVGAAKADAAAAGAAKTTKPAAAAKPVAKATGKAAAGGGKPVAGAKRPRPQ